MRVKQCSVVVGFRRWASLVLVAVAAGGCASQGLAFVQDHRVEIVAPPSHQTVKLPVTIRWRVTGFRVTGHDGHAADDAGYFAVFVDRAPVPPGKPLSWVAHDDHLCLATQGCPDASYLADRGVYSTTQTFLTLPQLPNQHAYRNHEQHEVTVVLMDSTGHRIGESAFYVDFFYDREAF
jgi:hypothetical protein